jgi:hypothetical protein
MHKLKLDLDQLAVESFDTIPSDGARRGTVQGFGPTPLITCNTCYDTCASCGGTCDNSCGGTCYCGSGYYTCGGSCYGTCTEPSCDVTCHTNCQQNSCAHPCL